MHQKKSSLVYRADVRLRQKWLCNRPLGYGLEAVLPPPLDLAESVPLSAWWGEGGDKPFNLFIDAPRVKTQTSGISTSAFSDVLPTQLSSTIPFSIFLQSVFVINLLPSSVLDKGKKQAFRFHDLMLSTILEVFFKWRSQWNFIYKYGWKAMKMQVSDQFCRISGKKKLLFLVEVIQHFVGSMLYFLAVVNLANWLRQICGGTCWIWMVTWQMVGCSFTIGEFFWLSNCTSN